MGSETWKAEVTSLRAAPETQQTWTGTPATAWHCHRLGNHPLLPLVLYFHTIHTSD